VADKLSNESTPDIVDVEAEKPTNQVAQDFWGPLVHIFTFVDLIVKIHILTAALLYPPGLSQSKEEQKATSISYRLWCLGFGCIILLFNLLTIFATINYLLRGEIIQFAKAFFVLIAWMLSISALIVVIHEKSITALMFAVEDEATHGRDESVMLIRAGQAGLRSLNNKLYGLEGAQKTPTASELLRSIGPLALLFLNKERNILRWGMVGAKVATKGVRFVQHLLKQK
jgi:hypothetical protein